MKVRRALVSVSDKAGLADLARTLTDLGVEILSTCGHTTRDGRFSGPIGRHPRTASRQNLPMPGRVAYHS